MKFVGLIFAGLRRKPVRSVLTFLSVSVAFLLFGVLHSVTASLSVVVDSMSDTRLRTMSRMNVLELLPMSYLPQIETVEGVRAVSHYTIFFGYYQEPTNGIGVGAIDVDSFLAGYPEYEVSGEGTKLMRTQRDGALVGIDLAEEQGWKVGDRIPVTSRRWSKRDGSMDWSFEIVGIVSPVSDEAFPAGEMWINYEYFDEERSTDQGTVNMFFELIDNPLQGGTIVEAVDDLFRNSSAETETQTEKDFVRSQINQIGDIEYFINAIIGAVLFTLMFVIGNTMMQSVRERVPELAVLKTYGFGDAGIVALVCVEALVLCGGSAVLGLGIAKVTFPPLFETVGAPSLPMPNSVALVGLGLAAALAFLSTAAPAWRIRRMTLVDALAGR